MEYPLSGPGCQLSLVLCCSCCLLFVSDLPNAVEECTTNDDDTNIYSADVDPVVLSGIGWRETWETGSTLMG